jgi:hypothetical protein
MKLSKWIDGKKFKPAHVGFYETKDCSTIRERVAMRYWDGKKWIMGWFNNFAQEWRPIGIAWNQSPTFRGLAEKP